MAKSTSLLSNANSKTLSNNHHRIAHKFSKSDILAIDNLLQNSIGIAVKLVKNGNNPRNSKIKMCSVSFSGANGYLLHNNYISFSLKPVSLNDPGTLPMAVTNSPQSNNSTIFFGDLSETTIENIEFFEKRGEDAFDFFAADELKSLFALGTENLFLSGCQLDYGLRIKKNTGVGNKSKYFSLKMEVKLEMPQADGQDSPNQTGIFPLVVFALPCPPDWASLNQMKAILISINKPFNIEHLTALYKGLSEPMTAVE